MSSTAPLNKTVDYLHQLRGSILPIDAVAYSQRHGHILTVDAQALRLWSMRKELAMVPRAPGSAMPVALHRLEDIDIYLLVLGGTKAPESGDSNGGEGEGAGDAVIDVGLVKMLSPSMGVLAEFRPHAPGVTMVAAAVHQRAGALITSGSDGELRVWAVKASGGGDMGMGSMASPGGSSSMHSGSAGEPKKVVVSLLCAH